MYSNFKAAGLFVLLFSVPVAAQVDAHGPDAWQVTGVAIDDTLNVRTGPGTENMIVGKLSPDASGLEMITCIPYLTRSQYGQLTKSELNDLPPRWCLMRSADLRVSGWASAHYLVDDRSTGEATLVDQGVALVRQLYVQRRDALAGTGPDPLLPSRTRDYFFSDVAAQLNSEDLDADPIFGAQDADIQNLHVARHPDRAMFRGMVSVVATFDNFGRQQKAVVRLRVDDSLNEPALRIMRIEHENWSYPR